MNKRTPFAISPISEAKNKIAYEIVIGDELNSRIEKCAGIELYQPTLDSVEDEIKRYTTNELSGLVPSMKGITCVISPSKFTEHGKYIQDATGIVKINIGKASVELPFVIVDSELNPFDIIQVGNQRVPYSRENMRRVAAGIIKADEEKSSAAGAPSEFKPFLGVEKELNPSSTLGFLGSTLMIRDQYAARSATGAGQGNFVTASDVSLMIEKMAEYKPLDTDRLTNIFKEATNLAVAKNLEKNASVDFTKFDKSASDEAKMIDNTNFVNANDLPHGTYINIPIITKAEGRTDELASVSGVVIKEFMNLLELPEALPPENTIVITSDNRIKILEKDESLLCIETSPSFKLNTTQINKLEEGDYFTALSGNKALYPLKLEGISKCEVITFDPRGSISPEISLDKSNILKKYSCEQSDGIDSPFFKKRNKNLCRIVLCTLKGTKFDFISYQNYIKAKSKELGIDDVTLANLHTEYQVTSKIMYEYPRGNDPSAGVVVIDPTTTLIKIKSSLDGYLASKAEFDDFGKFGKDTEVLKIASSESVELRTKDKILSTFDLRVIYTDKSQKFFKAMTKDFPNLEAYQVKGLLKSIGFEENAISDLILKTKRDNFSKMPLPMGFDHSSLSGGNSQSLMSSTMNKIKSTIFSPDILREVGALVAVAVLSQAADSVVKDYANKSIPQKGNDIKWTKVAEVRTGQVFNDPAYIFKSELEDKAKTASMLAEKFEKLAIDKRSKNAQLTAATLLLASETFTKTAEVVTSDKFYNASVNPFSSISKERQSFEKIAFDLVKLKLDQLRSGSKLIDPAIITASVSVIDDMVKTASAFTEIKEV